MLQTVSLWCYFIFLSIVSTNFNIIVDRTIGAPGHRKYVVDGINTCGKRYFMGKMRMIGTPEADVKELRMNAHLMICFASCILAKECKRLCHEEERVNCVNGYRKHKKREDIQKFKKRIYHLQDNDDVKMVGIKKDYIGFRKGNRNSKSVMYNIRCDPDLGVGKAAVRSIPCACLFCIEQINFIIGQK